MTKSVDSLGEFEYIRNNVIGHSSADSGKRRTEHIVNGSTSDTIIILQRILWSYKARNRKLSLFQRYVFV